MVVTHMIVNEKSHKLHDTPAITWTEVTVLHILTIKSTPSAQHQDTGSPYIQYSHGVTNHTPTSHFRVFPCSLPRWCLVWQTVVLRYHRLTSVGMRMWSVPTRWNSIGKCMGSSAMDFGLSISLCRGLY